MNDLFLTIEVRNLSELKKLINQAECQIDQLNETLQKIENFTIQAVS